MQAGNLKGPVVTVVDSRRTRILAHLSPLALVGTIFRNSSLIGQLAWREVDARYRSTQLGLLWSILNPLVMLAVYTFVFCGVMKARWSDTGDEGYFSFALILFAGLTAFNLFAEVLGRAVAGHQFCPNYVKKVVFPLEIFPVISIVVALSTFTASLCVLLVGHFILLGVPHWTVLLFPIVLLPMIIFSLGLGWLLSALGVFLRDIGQSIPLVLQLLVFMTPVFYPADRIPENLRPILLYNPITASIEGFRRVMLWGEMPDFRMLGIALVIGLITCQLGYAFAPRA